ncbi:unnamed protein product [Adineta steineri]|uniref:Phthiocerol/phthiodiolone dimycocerosyl transferase C-terminal domain-containing protein n=1 Tax=Adineta steineri TaxID=433720 RepID=A0A816G641_9BILA|nr:unnamed protein product [Adineta steineri]CAF1421493.1 unnamed protein product [Adineta steineri]CAF1574642.1 unnamed protein product [Adineta steineri]CAF1670670.1 unnamed protein product [Adineta steineri]
MLSKSHDSPSSFEPKQRLLGPAENGILRISQQFQGYQKAGQVLHLQGPYISLETLSSVISRLQCRHPFLRSRLQISSTEPDSYLMEEDDTLCLKILEIARKNADHLHFWRQAWKEREKDTIVIGQGLAEFWLLQDATDQNIEDSPREIVIVCDHSICDGVSLSTVAHELLIALSDNSISMTSHSLNWPITMEVAARQSLSRWGILIAFSKLALAFLYWKATSSQPTARLPWTNVDFSLDDMHKYCHTETRYGMLTKEETKKLFETCRREDVTVTSAISSAILCITSTLASVDNNQMTNLVLAIPADTRRRCIPPVPNHDLSYQVSGVMGFTMATRDTPTESKGMWQLAKTFGHHVNKSVDAGHILALAMVMGKIYQKNIGPIDIAHLPTTVITNWGLLPFHEQYGKWKLTEMTPIGNLIRAVMPVFMLQTVNGILTVACGGAVPLISETIIENLCNGTMHNLRQMIED